MLTTSYPDKDGRMKHYILLEDQLEIEAARKAGFSPQAQKIGPLDEPGFQIAQPRIRGYHILLEKLKEESC